MPVVAAGAALAAAGAGLSIAANKADADAIASARNKEAVAQQGYQSRAASIFNQNLPNNTAQAAQAVIAKGQSDRTNAFNALRNVSQAQSPTISPLQTPEQAAQQRTSTAGNTFGSTLATAQSKLGGYGDWQTQLGVQNQNVNSNLGVINNEARGNAALLPLQIERASHSGDALGAWGRIIGALGTVAGGASGSFGSSLASL